MIKKYEKGANIAAGIWFISMIALGATIGEVEGNIWDGGNPLVAAIFTVHGISLYVALAMYAKAKGYSAFHGLFFLLHWIGLVILLRLPDKTQQEGSKK